jgi:hypothetical protein
VLIATAVTISVSSCGGGGGDGDKGSADGSRDGDRAALSKAEYLQRANAVCADANKKQVALGEFPSSAAETVSWLDRSLSILASAEADLKALTPPSADAATITGYFKLLDDAVAKAKRAREAAARNDEGAFSAAWGDAESASAKANQAANEYGLNVCGTSSTSTDSDKDVAKDVKITSCGPEDGHVAITGTVVNSASDRMTYNISVVVSDASGTQVGDSIAIVNNLKTGGNAVWDADVFVNYEAGMVCELSDVSRI